MLYLSIKNRSVEALQTKQALIFGESVNSVARSISEMPLLVKGLPLDVQKTADQISATLSSAYPVMMGKGKAAITISDDTLVLHRFSLPQKNRANLENIILDFVGKELNIIPGNYENFYEVIEEDPVSFKIQYVAMPKSTLLNYHQIFKGSGLELVYLSAASFSIFEILKPYIEKNEAVLYISYEETEISCKVFDHHGILEFLNKKNTAKSAETDIQHCLDLFGKKNLNITQIIFGGAIPPGIEPERISGKLGKNTVKIGDILETEMKKRKIKLDAPGISVNSLDWVLGLCFQTHNKDAVNFAKGDFAEMIKTPADKVSAQVVLPAGTEPKDIKEVVPVPEKEKSVPEKEENATDAKFYHEPIVEYRSSGLLKLITSFRFIAGAVFILTFTAVTLVLVLSGKGNGFSLPFAAKPSLTPTSTLTPTVTATPTVDASLKRGDLKMKVENGTEKTGYAKEIAEYLEDKEYENIDRGNADRNDYEKTLIKIKEEKKNYLPLIESDLKGKLDELTYEDLENDNKYDLIIILGQN